MSAKQRKMLAKIQIKKLAKKTAENLISANKHNRLWSDRYFYWVNIGVFEYNILSVQTHNVRNISLTIDQQNSWLFQ